jgi:hypothetical protein
MWKGTRAVNRRYNSGVEGLRAWNGFEDYEAELRGCGASGGAAERGLGDGDLCRSRSRFGLPGSGASSYFQSSFFDSSILACRLLLENDFSVIYDWGMD